MKINAVLLIAITFSLLVSCNREPKAKLWSEYSYDAKDIHKEIKITSCELSIPHMVKECKALVKIFDEERFFISNDVRVWNQEYYGFLCKNGVKLQAFDTGIDYLIRYIYEESSYEVVVDKAEKLISFKCEGKYVIYLNLGTNELTYKNHIGSVTEHNTELAVNTMYKEVERWDTIVGLLSQNFFKQ